jgi:hypothetical protein
MFCVQAVEVRGREESPHQLFASHFQLISTIRSTQQLRAMLKRRMVKIKFRFLLRAEAHAGLIRKETRGEWIAALPCW